MSRRPIRPVDILIGESNYATSHQIDCRRVSRGFPSTSGGAIFPVYAVEASMSAQWHSGSRARRCFRASMQTIRPMRRLVRGSGLPSIRVSSAELPSGILRSCDSRRLSHCKILPNDGRTFFIKAYFSVIILIRRARIALGSPTPAETLFRRNRRFSR